MDKEPAYAPTVSTAGIRMLRVKARVGGGGGGVMHTQEYTLRSDVDDSLLEEVVLGSALHIALPVGGCSFPEV
jgi:hypothetical protein